MSKSETITRKIQDTTANPGPLGLMGFALTTILLNLHNTGMFGIGSMILAMGIFYGGLAQLFVGIMEWKKGNTFGTVAFTSYGSFWLTLVSLMILPELGWAQAPSATAMAYYLFAWGLFSIVLWIGTFKLNKGLQVVFGLLVILFFGLGLADLTGSAAIKHFAAYDGILTGLAAFYVAAAEILNELYGKTILPID